MRRSETGRLREYSDDSGATAQLGDLLKDKLAEAMGDEEGSSPCSPEAPGFDIKPTSFETSPKSPARDFERGFFIFHAVGVSLVAQVSQSARRSPLPLADLSLATGGRGFA